MAKQSGEKTNAILVHNAVRLPAAQKSLAGSNLRTRSEGMQTLRRTAARNYVAKTFLSAAGESR